jgi:uncharacterized protein (DUF302 family)
MNSKNWSALVVVAGLVAGLAPLMPSSPAQAQVDAGYRVVRAKHPFAQMQERLSAAIAKAGMNPVTRASASDGAKARGVTIRGDVVVGVFRNDFATRMLEANVDAGIEAPVRIHLVEETDGTTSLRYHLPSTVFGRYDGEAIKALGRELDPIFERIVSEAAGG